MTLTDKEKLRLGKNLIKSNNKKIKKSLEYIEKRLDEVKMDKRKFDSSILLRDIKEILES